MERKEFIKKSCDICLLGAAGILLPQLMGCSPGAAVYKTAIANNKLEVPANLFDKSTLQLVRPQGWYYDIVVQKNENNTYSALLLKCTHQDNQLTMVGSGYQCSLHGSQFDKTGKVRKGPAELPLKSYETTVIDNKIIINL